MRMPRDATDSSKANNRERDSRVRSRDENKGRGRDRSRGRGRKTGKRVNRDSKVNGVSRVKRDSRVAACAAQF